MDLLDNLGMSLLNFNFVMIYKIHKTSIFLKNNLSYLNIIFSKTFLCSMERHLGFF